MNKNIVAIALLLLSHTSYCQLTPYEKSNKTRTATYKECVQWYREFVAKYPAFELDSIGSGDIGKQIYVCRWVHHKNARPSINILINNNIHPGEPEGTDASMLMLRKLATDTKLQEKWEQVNIHVLCQYNVDGTLNRNCCSRANENGPEEFGFRGNAKNLDLNRDFIKMDSRNAQAFVDYFTKNNFHVFIDNHTSNGADYQYTLTSFVSHPQKLAKPLQTIAQTLNKTITAKLAIDGWPNCPYVELVNETPESGLVAFWETGRYATGFAALHHCIGFCVETHMLKPFPKRVDATLAYMLQAIQTSADAAPEILLAKRQAQTGMYAPKTIYTQWQLDTTTYEIIPFLGYQHGHKISKVTKLPRLFYDTNKPIAFNTRYYNRYRATDSIKLPRFYIVPQAWQEVIANLIRNKVELKRISYDTTMLVNVKYIKNYSTTSTPYESHYMHYNTKTTDTAMLVKLYAGDMLVPTKQALAIFIALVLEPSSPDSYFNWNYFDGVLMQKEYFSTYVWEDKAYELLQNNPTLRAQFETKQSSDAAFAADSHAQLLWI